MHTPSRHGRLIVDVPLANRDTGLVTGLTLFIELPVGGGILRSYTLRTTRLFRFPQLEGVRRAACHARVRVPTHARTPVPVRERRSLKLCLTVCCDPEGRYEGIGGKARAAVEALLLAVVVYLLLAEAVSLTPHSVTHARGLLGGVKGFLFPHPAIGR